MIAATGTNHCDLSAAKKYGVSVSHCRRYAGASVAQMVFSHVLALSTHIFDYHKDVFGKKWSQSRHFCLLNYPSRELSGKNFVVVGYGDLGQAAARLAEAFGMNVVVSERPAASNIRQGRIAFDQALSEADVLSLHCPLNDATEKMINDKTLSLMKPSAILINTARGGLIDEPSLLEALKNNVIAGAGLDVLSEEPPPEDHILLRERLANLLITPHTAWATIEARTRLLEQLCENLSGFFSGRPTRLVT